MLNMQVFNKFSTDLLRPIIILKQDGYNQKKFRYLRPFFMNHPNVLFDKMIIR